MPLSDCRQFRVIVSGVLLFGIALVAAGCDGAGSKRASLYQRLSQTGSWTVEHLEGGGFDYTSQINERYPEGLAFRFRDSEDGRTYTIVGRYPDDSTGVIARGAVALSGDDGLQLISGFERTITWTYKFQASRAIFALRFGSRPFLERVLSGGRRNQSLEMTLAPDDQDDQ